MGSYFKNWSSIGATKPFVDIRSSEKYEPLFGQVVEVYYNDPIAVGLIRVKINKINSATDNEDGIITVAEPADRNIIKYPVPGELVLLSVGITDDYREGQVAKSYYYTTVLSASGNVTINSNPYYLNKVGRDISNEVFKKGFETRFENKMNSPDSFLETKGGQRTIITRPVLLPYEGDLIIQSRWGSSIRFGSSGFNDDNQWSKKRGISGDPIMIISANSSAGTPTTVENVDKDDATMYICSSQTIPVTIALPRVVKTLSYVYNVPKRGAGFSFGEQEDSVAFIQPVIHDPPRFVGINGGIDYETSGVYNTGNPSVDLALTLIESREGTMLYYGWDIGHWRTGYGSHFLLLKDVPDPKTGKPPYIISTYDANFIHDPSTGIKYNGNPQYWPCGWKDRSKGILKFFDLGSKDEVMKSKAQGGSGFVHDYGMIWHPVQSYANPNSKFYQNKFFSKKNPEHFVHTPEEATLAFSIKVTTSYFPNVENAVADLAAWQAIAPGGQAALVDLSYNAGVGGMMAVDCHVIARTGNKILLANHINTLGDKRGKRERHAVQAFVCLYDRMPDKAEATNLRGDASAQAYTQGLINSAAAAAGIVL